MRSASFAPIGVSRDPSRPATPMACSRRDFFGLGNDDAVGRLLLGINASSRIGPADWNQPPTKIRQGTEEVGFKPRSTRFWHLKPQLAGRAKGFRQRTLNVIAGIAFEVHRRQSPEGGCFARSACHPGR
jgi:hypothetical protein